MTIFGELRAGLSPAVEELLEGFDSSSPRPLPRRELVVEAAVAAAFLATAVAMVLLIPGQRGLSMPVALTLVGAYAVVLAGAIRDRLRLHRPHPARLRADALPAAGGAVPLFVAAGIIVGNLPEYLTGRSHLQPAGAPTG